MKKLTKKYFEMFLPEELISDVYLSTNFVTCVTWSRHFEIKKLYDIHGHLEIVKWLYSNRREECTRGTMVYTAIYGHLEIVKWLYYHRTNASYTDDAMDYAAENGHLEIVKWLHPCLIEGFINDAMNFAAKNGHLAVLKWPI